MRLFLSPPSGNLSPLLLLWLSNAQCRGLVLAGLCWAHWPGAGLRPIAAQPGCVSWGSLSLGGALPSGSETLVPFPSSSAECMFGIIWHLNRQVKKQPCTVWSLTDCDYLFFLKTKKNPCSWRISRESCPFIILLGTLQQSCGAQDTFGKDLFFSNLLCGAWNFDIF